MATPGGSLFGSGIYLSVYPVVCHGYVKLCDAWIRHPLAPWLILQDAMVWIIHGQDWYCQWNLRVWYKEMSARDRAGSAPSSNIRPHWPRSAHISGQSKGRDIHHTVCDLAGTQSGLLPCVYTVHRHVGGHRGHLLYTKGCPVLLYSITLCM